MTKIVSVYSVQQGEGRTTVATTIAKLLGQANKSVLYVELDSVCPTFATTTALSHETKNILNYMFQLKNDGKLNATEFLHVDHSEKVFSKTVQFLTFPPNYEQRLFPTLINEGENVVLEDIPLREFAKLFTNHFKQLDFDIVLFVLPHDVGDLFGLPIMLDSDLILNVVTTNRMSLTKNKQLYEVLNNIEEFNMNDKWKIIVNKYVEDIPKSQLTKLLLGQGIYGEVNMIRNDHEKIVNDLTGEVGSTKVNADVKSLLCDLQLIEETTKRKRFFGVINQ